MKNTNANAATPTLASDLLSGLTYVVMIPVLAAGGAVIAVVLDVIGLIALKQITLPAERELGAVVMTTLMFAGILPILLNCIRVFGLYRQATIWHVPLIAAGLAGFAYGAHAAYLDEGLHGLLAVAFPICVALLLRLAYVGAKRVVQ
jgi:hypothetical protein